MPHSRWHPCIADGHALPDYSLAKGCTAVGNVAPNAQGTVVFEGDVLVSQQCPATRRRASSCFTTIPCLVHTHLFGHERRCASARPQLRPGAAMPLVEAPIRGALVPPSPRVYSASARPEAPVHGARGALVAPSPHAHRAQMLRDAKWPCTHRHPDDRWRRRDGGMTVCMR